MMIDDVHSNITTNKCFQATNEYVSNSCNSATSLLLFDSKS